MTVDWLRAMAGLWRMLGILAVSLLLMSPSAYADDESDCAPGHLLAENWSTDFCQSAVDYREILVGHPVKNGIPALSDPRMESLDAAAAWLSERSPVIAVELAGEARAYPLAVLMWHEIANDVIAEIPIAVTFCPLCNSSVSFDRRLDGELLEFGVSGLLRHSDLIMYDYETESWWQQLTGEGLAGDYAGALLEILPSQVISFGSFAERHPDGLVMSRDTGHHRQYGINPYGGYDSNPGQPFLFRGQVDGRLPLPVAHVLAAVIDGAPVAYPFEILRAEGLINDIVAGVPVVAFYEGGVASAMGDSVIDNARDIGTAGLYDARLDGQTLHFRAEPAGGFRDEETGSSWNSYGEATAGELAGEKLRWINAFPHFWFAWAAFYPDTLVYGLGD